MKYFAANNQEADRMSVSAEVDERTPREIYLAAFERVVTEAGPAAVMAAYNRINGVPASENRWLLTDVLRAEWGFEGVVVSDWGGVGDRVAALAAGLDLQMPGPDDAHDAAIVGRCARASWTRPWSTRAHGVWLRSPNSPSPRSPTRPYPPNTTPWHVRWPPTASSC
jgi:beta-glucosidase